MAVPQPIPYQGSKRAIANAIIARFPPDVGRLVEPFAGSGAVSLAAAHDGKANRFLLNDINEPLIQLWDRIINDPEVLASEYSQLWQAQIGKEKEFYNMVRARFNQTHEPSLFLYLLARCVKASVRYNPTGEFNQSPDNRRKGAAPEAMRTRIKEASLLLRGKTELRSLDYRDVISNASPQDVVYMDPPYQGVSSAKDKRYIKPVSFSSFVVALEDLNKRGVPFIVSYDGQTGNKKHGIELPEHLHAVRLEIKAGRSSQATLLGKSDETVESLYLSNVLVSKLKQLALPVVRIPYQGNLFAAQP